MEKINQPQNKSIWNQRPLKPFVPNRNQTSEMMYENIRLVETITCLYIRTQDGAVINDLRMIEKE